MPMGRATSAQALEVSDVGNVGNASALDNMSVLNSMGVAANGGGLVANTTDGQVKVVYIWPKNGQIEVEAESPKAELFPRRILMVYYDYENGVTEAEADIKAQTLGEKDYADWAILVQEYQYDKLNHKGKFYNRPDMKLDEVNKTDIVYFAMEFGEREIHDDGSVTWSNMSWVREKLDYRNCVHASNYQEGDNCKVVSTGVGKIDYWSWAKQPTDEHILTWDDEWWTIQQQRLAKIDNESIDVTVGFYYSANEQERDEWADKARDLLRQLKKMKLLFAKMESPGTLVAWRDTVEQRLLELGLALDEDNEGGETNKDDEGGEINKDEEGENGAGDKHEPDTDEGGNVGSGDVGGSNEDDIASQGQGNRNPLTVVDLSAMQAANQVRLTRNTDGILAANESVAEGLAIDEAGEEQETSSVKVEGEVSMSASTTEAEMEVPATGGVKRRIWDFWWVLIPIVGVLIMLILWLKRAFGRDED